MLKQIHESMVKSLLTIFNSYGIYTTAKFNPEIDMIKEYIRSIRYRDLISNKFSDYFKGDLAKGLLFYNYSAPTKVNVTQRKTFQVYFYDTRKLEVKEINTINKHNIHKEYYDKDNRIRNNPIVKTRDMFFGKITYDFSFVTSNLDLMLYFQTFYTAKLALQNKKFKVTINIPEYEEMEFENHLVVFSDLTDFSYINLEDFGSIFKVDFNVESEVPIISDYFEEDKFILNVDININI